MSRSKLIFFLALLLSAVTVFGTVTFALENNPAPVSPGVEVLANRLSVLKTAIAGDEVAFRASDFEKALGYLPASITVTELPAVSAGVLKLGAIDVTQGQIITSDQYEKLRLQSKAGKDTCAVFTFMPIGAAYQSAIQCRVFLTKQKNGAPQAVNGSLQTFAGICLCGTLQAYDPEGEALCYTIVSAPNHGTLTLLENGRYRYCVTDDYFPTDSFSFTVTDAVGQTSEAASVSISILDRTDQTVYADMEDHYAYFAALCMAEADILRGESVAGVSLFRPQQTISRGDFLSAALKAAELTLPQATQTALQEDVTVPVHQKNAALFAQENDLLSWCANGEAFNADQPITRAQATVILARLLEKENGPLHTENTILCESVPTEYKEEITALCAAGVLQGDNTGSIRPNDLLLRGECAVLLLAFQTALHR